MALQRIRITRKVIHQEGLTLITTTMKGLPKKIYLQVSDDIDTSRNLNGEELMSITWHWERLNDSDIEYILTA